MIWMGSGSRTNHPDSYLKDRATKCIHITFLKVLLFPREMLKGFGSKPVKCSL
jgi:hypothetical protein